MKNKNFEYTGWKINGFVALVLILAAIVGAVFMIVKGANTEVPMGPILVVGGELINATEDIIIESASTFAKRHTTAWINSDRKTAIDIKAK